MIAVTNALQWIVGSALIVGALGGLIADMAGMPTIAPAYDAVGIGAGTATLPTETRPLCWLRERVSV